MELRDQQLDARTAALVVTALGDPLLASTVRTWQSRGRLVPCGEDGRGRRVYRLGDVLDLAQDRRRA
jgi:hypothetical protein